MTDEELEAIKLEQCPSCDSTLTGVRRASMRWWLVGCEVRKMTVYELIKALMKYEPDDEVMVIDCGEDVPILSVGDTDGRPVLFPWPQDGVGEG